MDKLETQLGGFAGGAEYWMHGEGNEGREQGIYSSQGPRKKAFVCVCESKSCG